MTAGARQRGRVFADSGLIDTRLSPTAGTAFAGRQRTYSDTWTRGDFMPGNMLAVGHDLTGVIDLGLFGVADISRAVRLASALDKSRGADHAASCAAGSTGFDGAGLGRGGPG